MRVGRDGHRPLWSVARERLRAAVAVQVAVLILVAAAGVATAHPPRSEPSRDAVDARPGDLVRHGSLGAVAPPRGQRVWGEIHFVDGAWETLEVDTDSAGVVTKRHTRVVAERANPAGTESGGEGAAAIEAEESPTAEASPSAEPSPTAAPSTTAAPSPSPAVTQAPQATPTATPRPTATATPRPTATATPRPTTAECTTSEHYLYSWRMPAYSWAFQTASTPSYLAGRTEGTRAVLDALKRANNNIVTARNVCGRADGVSATYRYLGTTGRYPNISSTATCTGGNGYSTIGFGRLPTGIAGMACAYGFVNGTAREADIKLSTGVRWETTRTCYDEYYIESVMTHELGHVYGLKHVSSTALTMYRSIRKCSKAATTLGLGDMRGLERKY